MEIKQFKLDNNEEVFAEVVEWNSETNDEVVIRQALRVVAVDSMEESMRYFTFKPWMAMESDPTAIHTIKSKHIVGISTPSKIAMTYYKDVIEEMKSYDDDNVELLTLEDIEVEELDSDHTPVQIH